MLYRRILGSKRGWARLLLFTIFISMMAPAIPSSQPAHALEAGADVTEAEAEGTDPDGADSLDGAADADSLDDAETPDGADDAESPDGAGDAETPDTTDGEGADTPDSDTTPQGDPDHDPWAVEQDEVGSGIDQVTYFERVKPLRDAHVNPDEPILVNVDTPIDHLDELDVTLEVPEAGSYALRLGYRVPGQTIQELKVSIKVNGASPYVEAQEIHLPVAWRTEDGEARIDQYGNQTYPMSLRIDESFEQTLRYDMFNLAEPLLFPLEAGENTITVRNNELDFVLETLAAVPVEDPVSYDDYLAALGRTPEPADTKVLIAEGEGFSRKSHAHVRGERTKSVHYHPFSAEESLINVLADQMWQTPGEWVSYTFDVETPGFYRIGARYLQGTKQEMPVFKNVYIDGEIPFDGLVNYPFPYTKNNVEVHWLTPGGAREPYWVYLEAGEHTVTFESTATGYFEPYELLLRTIQEMNLISLDIRMITGNRVDVNRDWTIEEYIPDIEDRLLQLVDNLDQVLVQLDQLSGGRDVTAWANLRIVRDRIKSYTVDRRNDRGLDRLVNNLEVFSQGDGSLAEQLATALQQMLEQPMAVDQVYLAGASLKDMPSSPNFFQSLWMNMQKLFSSFNYENPDFSLEEDALNIWVRRPVTFIDVMRDMINQQYPGDIKINLSAMPDESRLLLSIIAGEAPDGVLGVTTGIPYDYALRGAAYDLRNFPDFGEVTRDFTAEMFLPFAFDDGIYALPETATFFVLFYRTDIMERLGLEVPNTWEELLEILPELDRQGMNVQTMLASTDAFKHFGTTVPFIQQFDGELYHDDGLSVHFDHPKTIESFELLTDLYIRYNLPNRIVNFYNNFKSGVTPLGVSDLGSYVLLKNAAPEINGQWDIAPNLGRVIDDGHFINTQPDITSAVMITEQSEKKEAMWEFAKWWMSDEVQLQYGNELQMRFGKEYIWATANLEALKSVPYIDQEDRAIIYEQVRVAKEIPRHPAYFQVERELSNAWNTVVFDGTPVREALDRAAISSDRMIDIKLQEFGYLDPEGRVLKPLLMPDVERIETYADFRSSEPLTVEDLERLMKGDD